MSIRVKPAYGIGAEKRVLHFATFYNSPCMTNMSCLNEPEQD